MARPSIVFVGSTIAAGYTPGMRGDLAVQPLDASGDLAASVESVLAIMPARSKGIYVLTTDIWSQAVGLETRLLRRVEKKKVPQLVSYEAQALSGMPSQQARTAVALLEAQPLETLHWALQMETSRYNQLAEAVAFSGCRLLGVCHPAGLPASLCRRKGPWGRLEVWNDVTMAVWDNGRGKVSHRFLDESPEQLSSLAQAGQWLADAGGPTEVPMEVIYEESLPAAFTHDLGTDPAVLSLQDRAHLHSLLELWGFALGWSPQVPCIGPVRQPTSAQTKRKLAIVVTSALTAALLAHYNARSDWYDTQSLSLQQEIADLEAPLTAFQTGQKQLAADEKKLARVAQQVTDLQSKIARYENHVRIHRSRMKRLLQLLAGCCPEEMMIRQITGESDAIRIVGRSVTSQPISQMAQRLAGELEPLHLSLEVPRVEALLQQVDGGPYEFEFVVRDSS